MQQAANFQYASQTTITGGRRYGARLTPQEEEIIKVSFESFSELSERKGDPVGKRYINAEKLTEAFLQINAKSDMQDIQLLLDDIDENGDGIDEDMWRHIMSRKFLGEEDDSSFGHVFSMLDDNKDGFIPLVELRKMLMQEGQAPLSEQEVDELLMFADADSDGLIDYKRFLLWLSHPEAFHKDQADSKTAVAQAQAQAKAGPPAAAAKSASQVGLGPRPAGAGAAPLQSPKAGAPGTNSPKAAGAGALSPKAPGPGGLSPKAPAPGGAAPKPGGAPPKPGGAAPRAPGASGGASPKAPGPASPKPGGAPPKPGGAAPKPGGAPPGAKAKAPGTGVAGRPGGPPPGAGVGDLGGGGGYS